MLKKIFLKNGKLFRLVSLCSIFFPLCTEAQDCDTIVENDTVSLNVDSAASFNLLMLSIGYSSNKMDDASQGNIKTPALITDAIFYSKFGLWSGLSYTEYVDVEKPTKEFEFQLGFQKYFAEFIDLDLYYANHNFSGDTAVQGINYSNSLSFDAGLDFENINFYIENQKTFGETNNYFLNFNLIGEKVWERFIHKNDLISITGTLTASFGTDYWLYEGIGVRQKKILETYLNRNNHNIEEFSYLGFNYTLGMFYNIDNWALSCSWLYNTPSDKFELLSWPDQTAYLISIIYTPNI